MAGAQFTVYRYLRPWRKYRGLTLKQAEERTGSKSSTISGWETGARTVDLDDLQKLADAYRAHPAALLFDPPCNQHFFAMTELSGLLRNMTAEQAEAWINLGKIIAGGK